MQTEYVQKNVLEREKMDIFHNLRKISTLLADDVASRYRKLLNNRKWNSLLLKNESFVLLSLSTGYSSLGISC